MKDLITVAKWGFGAVLIVFSVTAAFMALQFVLNGFQLSTDEIFLGLLGASAISVALLVSGFISIIILNVIYWNFQAPKKRESAEEDTGRERSLPDQTRRRPKR